MLFRQSLQCFPGLVTHQYLFSTTTYQESIIISPHLFTAGLKTRPYCTTEPFLGRMSVHPLPPMRIKSSIQRAGGRSTLRLSVRLHSTTFLPRLVNSSSQFSWNVLGKDFWTNNERILLDSFWTPPQWGINTNQQNTMPSVRSRINNNIITLKPLRGHWPFQTGHAGFDPCVSRLPTLNETFITVKPSCCYEECSWFLFLLVTFGGIAIKSYLLKVGN